MKPDNSLPPLKSVERVLRETTEHLARECGRPSGAAPDWSEFHWCVAQAVAAMQGVSPLLSRRLRWQGPRSWCQFLGEQWQHTCTRQQRIAQLLVRIDAQARAAGLAMLALKGVALHEMGIYAAGMRPMADIDLLVHPDDATAAGQLLESLGYRESSRTHRERTFETTASGVVTALGESSDRQIKIELHTRIAERLPVCEPDITPLLLPARSKAGLQRYESAVTLMIHLLLHAAGNIRARSLRLMQLNDISALAAYLSIRDWDRVLRAGGVAAWWVYPPLALTARYYPWAIPAEVLARASAACPRLLRSIARRQTVADVSLSHLWIEYIPGWEWCNSVADMLRYLRMRAFPSRECKAEVRQQEASHFWAASNAWTQLSRPRRVARWLVSRTPRVATIWSVGEAWRQAGKPQPGSRYH